MVMSNGEKAKTRPGIARTAAMTGAVAFRRFGFVAFERKEDCQRALAMCGKNMFLIGNSARPVVVEMARTEVCTP